MQLRLLFVGCFFFLVNHAFAQQILSGKVSNNQNEPVIGATITISGSQKGTTTNVEGRFTILLSAGSKYQIEVSAVGYQPKIISDVESVNGAFSELNILLEPKSGDLEGVTVTAKRTTARMETAASAIQFQKNTNTVAAVISAETISRSPDKNTGEVLKRTTGTSIQDGKFLVVRGLPERYNQATLNGILLTSTEPDRKAFSFDVIPAQIIDNIVINKAFVPELPGEWAGGLIQVTTKDIPSTNFLNVQIGTGFNTQTIGHDFYKAKGGKTDWLGSDDGTRALPSSYTTKSQFDNLSPADKTAIGKQLRNIWTGNKISFQPNAAVQISGGFSSGIGAKKIGGVFGLLYNKSERYLQLLNRDNNFNEGIAQMLYSYNDDKYAQDVTLGAFGNVSAQFNPLNKIALKAILNVNSTNYITMREGTDFTRGDDLYGNELTFRQNTFFSSQLTGEHGLLPALKFKWYGSFNILDGYSPDQRRILYTRPTGTTDPYSLLIGNTLSQQTGSRIFQDLSDYIYTAGGDLNYNFNWLNQKQTLKGGYMLQIKDRLYDGKFFANALPIDNAALRLLPPDQVFASENFGNGVDDKIAFDAIKGNDFRYLANTILNAGYLQLDNQIFNKLRIVWGVRVEDYDQLVGSVHKSDPRYSNSRVTDFLPGLNATYKLNDKTNIRLSGSQTIIRPELRELSRLNYYDFELNAAIQGNPQLLRTKVTNLDLRYELYTRSGELITFGGFYKHFDKPIEQLFNQGGGGASTFTFRNADQATAYGIEIELRKKLDFVDVLKNVTFQGNAAYINSKVKSKEFLVDRPMQGQSPYLLNLGLMYDLPEKGLNATLLFNQIGKRIYLVGDLVAGGGAPDIWEAPRPVLDFQIAQKLLQNKATIRLTISDILNKTQTFYQNGDKNTDFEKNKDGYRFTRKYGSTFGLSFNYSF